VHVNAIGAYRPAMRELPDELLADAAVVVDDRAAVLEESGEVIHALEAGVISVDDLTELGPALASAAARPRRPGRTAFKTVGIAPQDWAIAALLAERCLVPGPDPARGVFHQALTISALPSTVFRPAQTGPSIASLVHAGS
jgi:ornithine cyclodeaminase